MKKSWRRMGSVVRVLEVYELRRSFNGERRRSWERVALDPPRSGWIVGYRTIFEGVVKPGASFGDDYDPPYLSVERSIRCLLVAFTPYTKPVRVPIGGYDEVDVGVPHSGVPESVRKFLSEDAKNYLRDARGRFA